MRRIDVAFRALRELGLRKVGLYALYRLGLHFKLYPFQPEDVREGELAARFVPLFPLPSQESLKELLGEAGKKRLVQEANTIAKGKFRAFEAHEVALRWEVPHPLRPWFEYALAFGEKDSQGSLTNSTTDIVSSDWRFIWEPARLGWVFTLGRAYCLDGEERFARSFWELVEGFVKANPPYYGLHWVSAQEAGLRILALAFALHVFAQAESSTPDRLAWLCRVISVHAQRILPTQIYARAQNNNHLLSEAAGLFTAGLLLPHHPRADSWVARGWRVFNIALRTQISVQGTYMQHSTNYHRMMLQLALWVRLVGASAGFEFAGRTLQRLQAATHWLIALMDKEHGGVPNLGPNDGTHILPLALCPFQDYRPTLQAAAMAFLGGRLLPAGEWDEMALWLLGRLRENPLQMEKAATRPKEALYQEPLVLSSTHGHTWAYLRATKFDSRPGHADQLHLDIWWRGRNLAVDAGTFLYNAPPPWNNSLSSTMVHNTVTVDHQDQMLRAGRFLYLGWAQARLLDIERDATGHPIRVVAEHDGYQRFGLIHRRCVSLLPEGDWHVEDFILPLRSRAKRRREVHHVSLHWMLPQELFTVESIEGHLVTLVSDVGRIRIELSCTPEGEGACLVANPELQIICAGKLLFGSGECPPILGWYSPTYGVKISALSIRLMAEACAPIKLQTCWRLSRESPNETMR